MNRYAAAADRARLLYRFPTAPNARRTLELYQTGKPLLGECEWPGANTSFCRVGPQLQEDGEAKPAWVDDHIQYCGLDAALPYEPASFDLIVLHSTLDDLNSMTLAAGKAFEPSILLNNIFTVMAPGGILAGCVNNRWAIKSWMQRMRRAVSGGPHTQPSGRFSLKSLRMMLSATGYSDIHLFTLLPNSSAPFKLIDTDPAISRAAFRHELQIMRRYMRLGPSYFLRRVAVEMGLNRHVEQAIFFWAVKPC